MIDPTIAESQAYANLIANICKLTPTTGSSRGLEQEVFRRLGYETTITKRGYSIRKPGDTHWQSMPQILSDFGTAVRHTIGHRFGELNAPLDDNWYVREMSETVAFTPHGNNRIAAWAVRLHKEGKPFRDAVAITPAAALVAAWLSAHP